MNFQPLYTAARVVTATYRTLSYSVLLVVLLKRISNGRDASKNSWRGNDERDRLKDR